MCERVLARVEVIMIKVFNVVDDIWNTLTEIGMFPKWREKLCKENIFRPTSVWELESRRFE